MIKMTSGIQGLAPTLRKGPSLRFKSWYRCRARATVPTPAWIRRTVWGANWWLHWWSYECHYCQNSDHPWEPE